MRPGAERVCQLQRPISGLNARPTRHPAPPKSRGHRPKQEVDLFLYGARVEARLLEHDQAGSGDPPIVLLPGGLTGWEGWLPLVPALSANRRVIRVQLIANAEGIAGQIGDPTYDTDLERESLRLTLDSMGVEEMHLVGWSNGGRMALDFALAFPERIRTLTAIEPAAWWLVDGVDQGARDFATFIARCAGRDCSEDDVREFLIGAGVGAPDTDFSALPQWEFWVSCRQVISWYGEKAVRSAEAGIEGFERLDVPTLLVRGTSTAPWLRKVVDLLDGGLPKARIVGLAGGHASILESPDAFLAALNEHVAGN